MPIRRSLHFSASASSIFLFIVTCAIYGPIPAYASLGFQPVSPDELKMTSEPLAPGAPAIILYRASGPRR
jgi:hypothetical protein